MGLSSRCGYADIGKGVGDMIGSMARSAQHVCLPDAHYCPACGFEGTVVFAIARHVSSHLRDPVRRVVASAELRQAVFQIASVPEVSIAEDHDTMPGKYDIRATGQPGNV